MQHIPFAICFANSTSPYRAEYDKGRLFTYYKSFTNLRPLKRTGSGPYRVSENPFSTVFSPAREKTGPPEARRNRPQRNKSSLLRSVQNDSQQLVAAVAFFSGEGNQAHIVRQGQNLADAGQIGLDLAFFELIELVGDHHEGLAGL